VGRKGNLPRRVAVLGQVAGYRVKPAGEVEIRAHRVKSIAVIATSLVFTVVCAWSLIAEPRALIAWLGIALFGAGGAYFVSKQIRLGLLRGGAALVIGPDGLWDRVAGVRIRWEHVQELELWEYHVRGTTQRFLGVRASPEAPAEPGALGSVLSDMVLGAERPRVNISRNLLAVTDEELVQLLRRYWHGPIRGGWTEPGPRRSRLRRLLGWVGGWALTFAVGIALTVVLVVALEAC
jgi:hypothetical protein